VFLEDCFLAALIAITSAFGAGRTRQENTNLIGDCLNQRVIRPSKTSTKASEGRLPVEPEERRRIVKKYISGIGGGTIAGAAMLLSLGAIPAQAQMPGGSYLQSCTNVRAHGDRVVATCRRTDGSWERTAINDVRNCNGGLANMNGQLTCGRRTGPQYGWDRRHRGFGGYGSSNDPRFERSYGHHGWRGDYDYYGR
jgi:hypothetical protein